MISQNILDMIRDTVIRKTVEVTVSLDPDKTGEVPGDPNGLFRPDVLRANWSRVNGEKWRLIGVVLSGPRIVEDGEFGDLAFGVLQWKTAEDASDKPIPMWAFEIVQETKPKE